MPRRKSKGPYKYIHTSVDKELYDKLEELYQGKWNLALRDAIELRKENETLKKAYENLNNIIDGIKNQLDYELSRIHNTIGAIRQLSVITQKEIRKQVDELNNIVKDTSQSVETVKRGASFIEDLITKELEEKQNINKALRRFIQILLITRAKMKPEEVEETLQKITKCERDYQFLDIIEEVMSRIEFETMANKDLKEENKKKKTKRR